MVEIDRLEVAATYKKKSDESISAAQVCLEKSHIRAVCNRAWYAVMQIVTSAAYTTLKDNPPANKTNWNHARIPDLFRDVTRKNKCWERYRHLSPQIRILLDMRECADYGSPEEDFLSLEEAQSAVKIADQVRTILSPLAGDEK